jgi:tRNA pseudouridine32 synthase / 23S rRNA pseudouridine746 synthase
MRSIVSFLILGVVIWGCQSTSLHIAPYCDVERLLYVDSDILVYDKAPNFLCVPGVYEKDSLVGRAASTFKVERVDQMVAHRLDYATSGIVVFARHAAALTALHDQFRRREVQKIYKSVVSRGYGGQMPSLDGDITLPIQRDSQRGAPFMSCGDSDGQGKESHTVWRTKSIAAAVNGQTLALLSMQPRTGRTHQLRVHAAAVGMPMVGDAFYAPPDVQQLAPRLHLHAEQIFLTHPVSGRPVTFKAQCPFRIL